VGFVEAIAMQSAFDRPDRNERIDCCVEDGKDTEDG
jgi:hypothetical protein